MKVDRYLQRQNGENSNKGNRWMSGNQERKRINSIEMNGSWIDRYLKRENEYWSDEQDERRNERIWE